MLVMSYRSRLSSQRLFSGGRVETRFEETRESGGRRLAVCEFLGRPFVRPISLPEWVRPSVYPPVYPLTDVKIALADPTAAARLPASERVSR